MRTTLKISLAFNLVLVFIFSLFLTAWAEDRVEEHKNLQAKRDGSGAWLYKVKGEDEPFTGLMVRYSTNSKSRPQTVVSQVKIVNGHKEGLATDWNTNQDGSRGKVIQETAFKDGKKNGPLKIYFRDSDKLKIEAIYKDDQRVSSTEYFPDGTKRYVEAWSDGKRTVTYHWAQEEYAKDGSRIISMGDLRGNGEKGRIATARHEKEPFTGLAFREDQKVRALRVLAEYKNGLKDGLEKIWQRPKDGQPGPLKQETHWLAGLRQGEEKVYHTNGAIWAKRNYKDNVEHGPYESYIWEDKPGQVSEKGTKNMDKREGLVVFYHKNGTLAAERIYKDGKRDGLCKEYDDKGKLKQELNYKDGKEDGPFKKYYPNGQIREEGAVKGASFRYSGLVKRYEKDGTLKHEFTYSDGKKDGPFRVYYQDGKVREEGCLKNQRKQGEYKSWYRNGQQKQQYYYQNGTLHGPVTEWNEDGTVWYTGFIKNGSRVKEKVPAPQGCEAKLPPAAAPAFAQAPAESKPAQADAQINAQPEVKAEAQAPAKPEAKALAKADDQPLQAADQPAAQPTVQPTVQADEKPLQADASQAQDTIVQAEVAPAGDTAVQADAAPAQDTALQADAAPAQDQTSTGDKTAPADSQAKPEKPQDKPAAQPAAQAEENKEPAQLVYLYRKKGFSDFAGRGEEVRGNGSADAQFKALLSGPGKTITGLAITAADGGRSAWNTTPGDGLWLLGVAIKRKLQNDKTGAINIRLGDEPLKLDLYVQDDNSIALGRARYQLVITFADGTSETVPVLSKKPKK